MNWLADYLPKKPAANGPTLRSCDLVLLNPSWPTREGKKYARPKSVVPIMKYIIMVRITWGDVADRNISLKVNFSVLWTEGRSISSLRTMMLLAVFLSQNVRKDDDNQWTNSFSLSVRNLEPRGVDGTRTNPTIPIKTLNNPSYSFHQRTSGGQLSKVSYQYEYPRPACLTSNPIHVFNGASEQSRKCSRKLDGTEVRVELVLDATAWSVACRCRGEEECYAANIQMIDEVLVDDNSVISYRSESSWRV